MHTLLYVTVYICIHMEAVTCSFDVPIEIDRFLCVCVIHTVHVISLTIVTFDNHFIASILYCTVLYCLSKERTNTIKTAKH